MNNYEKELISVASPYWEAEAEIVKRFFRKKPSKEDHVFWLKAQLWKELHPVDGYFSGLHSELAHLVELFPRVDKDITRHHYHFLLQQLVEEFNHYLMQADILESLSAQKISPEDTVQLPEEKKLQEIRRRYTSSGSEVDKAAVLVTEGGGSRMFREGRKIKGGPLERKIAKAMNVIYTDEKDHVQEAVKEAAKLINNQTDLKRMKKAIREISLQRVYMRNEMFRNPLTEEELKRLLPTRGKAS